MDAAFTSSIACVRVCTSLQPRCIRDLACNHQASVAAMARATSPTAIGRHLGAGARSAKTDACQTPRMQAPHQDLGSTAPHMQKATSFDVCCCVVTPSLSSVRALRLLVRPSANLLQPCTVLLMLGCCAVEHATQQGNQSGVRATKSVIAAGVIANALHALR